MNILAIDCDLSTHDELVNCAKTCFPEASIRDYTDPFLALKFGINNPTDMLLIHPQMRLTMVAGSITSTLRETHPAIQVVFVTDSSLRRTTDYGGPPDVVLQLPLTPEKLRSALKKLSAEKTDKEKNGMNAKEIRI